MATEAIVAMFGELNDDERLAALPCPAAELTAEEAVGVALAASDYYTMLQLHDGDGCDVVYGSHDFAMTALTLVKHIKYQHGVEHLDVAALRSAALKAALDVID